MANEPATPKPAESEENKQPQEGAAVKTGVKVGRPKS